ncbi:MAG TPA: hypothetical protein PKO28_04855 [Bacilli bacterium]|nr:hypothetical protein [Bacilli bacterium]HPS19092.1 hypothetical protein [Bacilli bacterium]
MKKFFSPKKLIVFITLGLLVVVTMGCGGYLLYNYYSNTSPSYDEVNPHDYEDDNTSLYADYEQYRLESPAFGSYISRYNPCQLFNLAIYQSAKNNFIKYQATGLVNMGGLKQDIHTYHLKNNDQYFYESLSKGLVSIAKRFYQDVDVTWYRGKYNQDNQMIWNPSSETSLSIDDFNEQWGYDLSRLSPYIASSYTCLSTSQAYVQDNKIVISLNLDPFYSVLYYAKQMVKMGGLEEKPIFKTINVQITINSDFLIETRDIVEAYKVKKFSWFDAVGTVSEVFTYGVEEAFPPLETEIIYS